MAVHILDDLKMLILLTIANGTPVMLRAALKDRWAHALDRGLLWSDGRPLLGKTKTIRGFLIALLLTTVSGTILGINWLGALLIALTALAGDLFSSFVKRRMGLPASSMALGLDQIPESLLPCLVGMAFLSLSVFDIAVIVGAFFAGELLLSRVLYRLHIRERPY